MKISSIAKRITQNSNIVEHPAVKGETGYLGNLDMFVMDVLTPVLGFENGTYALYLAGYKYVGDIVASLPEEIAKVQGMSERKLSRLKSFLRKHHLDYGVNVTKWRQYRARQDSIDPIEPRPQTAQIAYLRLVR